MKRHIFCAPSPAGLSYAELVQAVQVLLGQGQVAQEACYHEWLAGSEAEMTQGAGFSFFRILSEPSHHTCCKQETKQNRTLKVCQGSCPSRKYDCKYDRSSGLNP